LNKLLSVNLTLFGLLTGVMLAWAYGPPRAAAGDKGGPDCLQWATKTGPVGLGAKGWEPIGPAPQAGSLKGKATRTFAGAFEITLSADSTPGVVLWRQCVGYAGLLSPKPAARDKPAPAPEGLSIGQLRQMIGRMVTITPRGGHPIRGRLFRIEGSKVTLDTPAGRPTFELSDLSEIR